MEIGNIIFNPNQNQSYNCPEYIITLLRGIETRLQIEHWNKYQEELDSPFDNSGAQYKNDVFEVESYNWNDDYSQEYNFKWKDIKISWYKYLGRDTTINYPIKPEQAVEMFNECWGSINEENV